jgi:hypothetical protein
VISVRRLDHIGGIKDAVPELRCRGTGRLQILREVRDLTVALLPILRPWDCSR